MNACETKRENVSFFWEREKELENEMRILAEGEKKKKKKKKAGGGE